MTDSLDCAGRGAPVPVSPMEGRTARLEGAYEQVSERLTNIDPRFDAIDRRFDAVDRRFDAIDRKIDLVRDTLEKKIDKQFLWTIGIFITAWFALTGATITTIFLRH